MSKKSESRIFSRKFYFINVKYRDSNDFTELFSNRDSVITTFNAVEK